MRNLIDNLINNLNQVFCHHLYIRNLNSMERYKYKPQDNLAIFGGTKFPVFCVKCQKETFK